jgi:hypothetical protein
MQNPNKISRVVIYNRPSYPIRLSRAAVSLLDVYGNVMARVADIGDTTNVPIVSLNSGDFDTVQPKAKFLKITVPGATRKINMYEVQVFDYTGTNRALGSSGAVASQSSTLDVCQASNAIDGYTAHNYDAPCHGLAHTSDGGEPNPWWQVNMQNTYQISRVVIYNRWDCCSDRISSATVTLMDEYEHVIAQVLDIGVTTGINMITLDSADFEAVQPAPSNQPTEVRKAWSTRLNLQY